MEMKFGKIFIVSFLTVTVVIFGGCHAQNEHCLNNIDQKQCVCDSEASTPTVPDILFKNKNDPNVHNDNYNRQIIFVYKNVLNNDTKILIPNMYNQKLIPDPPIQKNDKLITITDETLNDKLSNYPDQVTLDNAVPHIPIGIDKIIKLLPDEPINTIDLNRKVPSHFREELWPASPKKILQAESGKIQPIHSNDDEPVLPINYSRDSRAGSHARNSVYSDKQGSRQSMQVPYPGNFPSTKRQLNKQMTNYYKLGNHILMVHPGYSHVQQPYGHKRIKYTPYTIQVPPSSYMIRDRYSKPGHHSNKFYQNNIQPNHSGGQKPIAPINYGKVIQPWSHMNVPHDFSDQEANLPVNIPYTYPHRLENIKPIDSGQQEPEYSEKVPHSHPHHPDDIAPIESEYSEEIPHSHPLYPTDLKPVGSDEQKPENSIEVSHTYSLHPDDNEQLDSGELKPENSEEVPHLYPLHPDDKPIDSGKQKLANSEEVPDSHPLQPSDIKSVNSGEQEPENSKEVSPIQSLHLDDIEPINSSKQRPENSKEVPDSHPLHSSDLKPVGSNEQKPENSEEAPYSHPPYTGDIEPIDSGEQKPENSEEVPNSHPFHPGNIESIDSGKQKPENPVEGSESHPLHSNDLKPADYDEQKPENSEEVAHSNPVHLDDIELIDSGEQKSENSIEVSHTHSLHPDDNKPINSSKQKPKNSIEVPHSHPPGDIEPIDSGEQKPEDSEKVPDSHPLHHNDLKLVGSDEQKPDNSKEVPHSHLLHPDDIKPIGSGEQKPILSEEIPDSHPLHASNIKPVGSDEQNPENSEEVPHSHPLHSDNIEPINSGEQKPKDSEDVPHSHPIHASDIKPVGSDEQKSENSQEIPHPHPLHPDDIKPIDSSKQEPKYSEDVSHSYSLYPSNINSVHPGEQKPSNFEEVPDSYPLYPINIDLVSPGKQGEYPNPSDIISVRPGKQEHTHVSYPVGIRGEKSKIVIDKIPCHNCNPMIYDEMIQNEIPRKIKWTVNNPVYYKWSKPYAYMGYKTYDEWFREQMHRLKNNNKNIDINSVGPLILKMFQENNMSVTYEGVLRDIHGRILPMQNFKLRPVLIGNSMSVDNLQTVGYPNNAISTWSEYVILTMIYPPKTLGILPLGTAFYPSSSPLDSFASKFKSQYDSTIVPQIAKKKVQKRESPNYLLTQKVDPMPVKINQPENKNQNMYTHVSEDRAVKTSYGHDKSVENFLSNMPYFLPSRKVYDKRKDLGKDDQSLLNNFIGESSKNPLNRKTLILKNEDEPRDQHPHAPIQNDDDFESHNSPSSKVYAKRKDLGKDDQAQLNNFISESSKTPLDRKTLILKNEDEPREQHPHAPIQNDDDFDLIRIIGGSAAIRSGIALNNKGRTAEEEKPNNHDVHNLKFLSLKNLKFLKKHFHDYINWEELHRDDSLVRIIGGNAATGSGNPLSNKGRSGTPMN